MNSSRTDALVELIASTNRRAETANTAFSSDEGWTPTIIETLSNLTDEEWQASAPHDTFGTVIATLLPEKIPLHDEKHLESLR